MCLDEPIQIYLIGILLFCGILGLPAQHEQRAAVITWGRHYQNAPSVSANLYQVDTGDV